MGALSHVSVLVVDDDLDNLELVSLCLEREDAIVHGAGSAAAAHEALASFRPDVVLCDLSLPDGDGCDLLVSLRADPNASTFGAIALTGHSGPESRRRAIDAGFSKHLSKPIDPADLVKAVASARPAASSQSV